MRACSRSGTCQSSKDNKVSVEVSHPILRIGGEPERRQVKLKSCLKSQLEIEACREIDEVCLALGFRLDGGESSMSGGTGLSFLGLLRKTCTMFSVQV